MEVLLTRYRSGTWSTPLPEPEDAATLVLVFGPSDPPPALAELATAYPSAVVAGCSSAGEIHGGEVHDDTLSVAIVRFAATRLVFASTTLDDPAESRVAGQRIAEQLAGPDLSYVLVLAEGLRINGTELVRGLNEPLGPGVVVTGGLAGDGPRFERTWVLGPDRRPRPRTVSAVGFYGNRLRVGHGSQGGWDPFGPERTVTRSAGNVLYELDGRPALELYEEYLGDRAAGLPATGLLFPLAIRRSGDDRRLVRTILGVDEGEQSLVFAGDVPFGWRAQLMRANFDRLVSGAGDAAELAVSAEGGPTLAIAISCVGRRLLLGERVDEEVESTLAAMSPGTSQLGFYSYGELSPVTGGSCELHNQTMTLTTLREA